MLKSKLIKRCDFTTFIVPEELSIQHDKIQKQVEDAVSFVAKKHVTLIESGDPIAPGDIVTVDIESDHPKLNQTNVQISVGIGFNKVIEDHVAGMKKGEAKTISLNGESAAIKVVNTKRRIVPQVTDEFIDGLNIENVHTIKDYEAHLYNEFTEQLKKQNVFKIAQAWIKQGVDNSEFEISEEDIANEFQRMKERAAREYSSYEDFIMAYASSAGLEKLTVEEFEADIRKSVIRGIKEALLGQSFASQGGNEFNQETYENELAELADKKGQPIEKLEKDYSFYNYIQRKYVLNYYDSVVDLSKKRIQLDD